MAGEVDQAEELREATDSMRAEMGKVIFGQEETVEQLLIALFSDCHCFMVGVPGLAKTLMVSTLARILDLSFKRIQFTPDVMPADITGTDIMQEDPETGKRQFEFAKGPIFANIVLADEINRSPPKTQSALLEAMQERQVTAGNQTYKLQSPFFVLATQNPIEQEGTYPLPEAQLDRFMLNILIDYPDRDAELDILKLTTVEQNHDIRPVMSADRVLELQRLVRKVPVAEHVFEYALELIRRSRPAESTAPDFVKEWLEIGAGPRAGQNLILGAKARALISGRFYTTTADVQALALPVLRHRLMTSFNAESEGVRVDALIERLLNETEPPHPEV